MLNLRTLTCLAAVLPAAGAIAAPSAPWMPSSGSTDSFDFSGGSSEEGFAVDPFVGEDFLAFFPEGFKAEIVNEGASLATEALKVRLTAPEMEYFTNLSVTFTGDYSIFGVGTVDGTGALLVTDLDSGDTITATSQFTPQFPISSSGDGADGTFTSLAEVTPPGLWQTVELQFDARLFAASHNSKSASAIAGKVITIQGETAIIPLPPAAFAAPVVFGLMYLNRRRLAKVAG
ncbi:MAG: hypothetical protein ACFCVE_02005 [Phycisphaerae bacterium]